MNDDRSQKDREFCLEGHVAETSYKDQGRLKRVEVLTADGLQSVKVSKYAQVTGGDRLNNRLNSGDRVRLTGWQTYDRKQGTAKLKALAIILLEAKASSLSHADPEAEPSRPLTTAPRPSKAPGKASAKLPTIKVCQKCFKRYGCGVSTALEEALADRNLSGHVAIQPTGCLKQCKQGPHVIMMPDKIHYSRLKPKEMATLVDQHIVPHVHPTLSPVS